MENFNIFIRSIFVDNMIFAYFLGMCSFLAVSKNVKTAVGLGVAVTFMLVISVGLQQLAYNDDESGHNDKLHDDAYVGGYGVSQQRYYNI